MNATESFRVVLDAAMALVNGASRDNFTRTQRLQLRRAITFCERRALRMESRLLRLRERNAKKSNRPKCLQ